MLFTDPLIWVLEGNKCPRSNVLGRNDWQLAVGLVRDIQNNLARRVALKGEEGAVEVFGEIGGVDSAIWMGKNNLYKLCSKRTHEVRGTPLAMR